jgi:hypothetical protein
VRHRLTHRADAEIPLFLPSVDRSQQSSFGSPQEGAKKSSWLGRSTRRMGTPISDDGADARWLAAQFSPKAHVHVALGCQVRSFAVRTRGGVDTGLLELPEATTKCRVCVY